MNCCRHAAEHGVSIFPVECSVRGPLRSFANPCLGVALPRLAVGLESPSVPGAAAPFAPDPLREIVGSPGGLHSRPLSEKVKNCALFVMDGITSQCRTRSRCVLSISV